MGFAFQCAAFTALMAVLIVFGLRALTGWPGGDARRALIEKQLNRLEWQLRENDAAGRMQKIFPEGACFTCTLHTLAWANLAKSAPDDEALRTRALDAMAWTLDQYDTPAVTKPFVDTQIRMGVFYLGQRNLALARYLDLLAPPDRPEALVNEFHENSEELNEAFLVSPTHHLDSYPTMCWPADNVTALVSLVWHDRLYGTDYRPAYEAWKSWTLANADPSSGMSAGMLNRITGILRQPARGCANSWELALLAQIDPDFAREQYSLYKRHFGIRRLGFNMFREYPKGDDTKADVDSGPIIWGAGMVATGVGLGAALAQGDLETAGDIHALSAMFGCPGGARAGDEPGREFLWGTLPVGDGFMTWGLSQPAGPAMSEPMGFFQRLARRALLFPVLIVIAALLCLRFWFALRHFRRRMAQLTAPPQEEDQSVSAPNPQG